MPTHPTPLFLHAFTFKNILVDITEVKKLSEIFHLKKNSIEPDFFFAYASEHFERTWQKYKKLLGS